MGREADAGGPSPGRECHFGWHLRIGSTRLSDVFRLKCRLAKDVENSNDPAVATDAKKGPRGRRRRPKSREETPSGEGKSEVGQDCGADKGERAEYRSVAVHKAWARDIFVAVLGSLATVADASGASPRELRSQPPQRRDSPASRQKKSRDGGAVRP